jgi:hypothetical protein
MLTITINNKPLSLNRDASIRLSWVNPACYMDDIPGDVGLGIDIPNNEINRAILGNPHRFEKYQIGQDRKHPHCEIRYSGVLLLSGTLRINKATDEAYSGWLQSDLGVLGEEQKEQYITDLDWKQNQTFANKGYDPGYLDSEDEYGVHYIRNRGFWDGKGKEVTVPIPYLDQNGIPRETDGTGSLSMWFHYLNHRYMVNAFEELDAIVTTGDGCVVSPYLFLRYVIKETFRKTGWYIDRNDMMGPFGITKDAFHNLKVYNNFSIIGMDYTTETVTRPTWDQDLLAYIDNVVPEITFVNWGLRNFNYADLLPKVSMKDFLLGIQNTLNLIFFFGRHKRVNIIDRNEILSETPIDLNRYKVGIWEVGERTEVTLKFMPEYDKEDALFGHEFKDLTDRRKDFKAAVDTYADLEAVASPEFGELRLVKALNKIYEWKFKVFTSADVNRVEDQIDTLGWEFVSSGPQPYLYGDYDVIEEIKTPLSTLQRNPTLGFHEAVQKGNLATMRSAWNDITFRILPSGSELVPDALNWDGDNGLYQQRWRKWARFWANRLPVEGEFDLPLNVLLMVVENIYKPFREEKGGFVIQEMETEIGLNMIGKTRIKGYKI